MQTRLLQIRNENEDISPKTHLNTQKLNSDLQSSIYRFCHKINYLIGIIYPINRNKNLTILNAFPNADEFLIFITDSRQIYEHIQIIQKENCAQQINNIIEIFIKANLIATGINIDLDKIFNITYIISNRGQNLVNIIQLLKNEVEIIFNIIQEDQYSKLFLKILNTFLLLVIQIVVFLIIGNHYENVFMSSLASIVLLMPAINFTANNFIKDFNRIEQEIISKLTATQINCTDDSDAIKNIYHQIVSEALNKTITQQHVQKVILKIINITRTQEVNGMLQKWIIKIKEEVSSRNIKKIRIFWISIKVKILRYFYKKKDKKVK
jgi:hypothetical protein